MLLCLPLFLGFSAEEAQAQTATLSISAPADAAEGDMGTTDKFFMVSLSSAASVDVTYTICFTSSGTATRGASDDFQTLNGGSIIPDLFGQCIQNKTLSAGQTSDSGFGMRIRGDTDAEPDETVIAQITLQGNPTGVTLGTSTATYTILDDDTPAPEISVSLPISEGESRSDAGEKKVSESEGGVGIGFNLSANQPLPSALTVCVDVEESGGDRVASGNEGIQTVNMPSSVTNGSGTHTLTWTNTMADDQDSSVTVEVVVPSTVGCSAANDSYTVSSSDASDKLLIQDDEDTTVSLTSSDRTMTEGDASDTATLTVSLDRRLYAGETIGVPIALATTTDAKLPGSTDSGTANHDFTVSAAAASMHSGVTLVNALTANPRVVFTGHDTNTVQTATVTLTPVANRDDDDAVDETITATITQPGSLDTTVSGGVTAHSSNNAATLTLEDDEAAPATCSAQNMIFSENRLRILETGGVATYCVRLTTAPSGGNTTVTIHRDAHTGVDSQNAVTVSPASLTFTSSNYQTPQQVTVTGVDEPNRHQDRSLRLRHAASGGGYSGNLANLGSRPRVNVDDAPEVEAWWDFNGRLGPHPSTLNLAGEGNPEANQNAAPFTIMSYAVRLSNRPEPGGTVTVTAMVPADKRHLISLSLNGSWPWRSSVDVEFKDRDAGAGTGCSNWHGLRKNEYFDSSGNIQTVTGGGNSETWDNSADTPWKCWRRIYVLRSGSRNIANTCVDITHTATGGGVRRVAIDTVRAHIVNSGSSRKCGWLTGNTLPQNSPAPAQAAGAPTEKISNLQVTEVDATSVSVTWDAVEHATSYDVSWSAESSDSLNASAGAESVTGTSATIQHDASVPMTLTVTVTPEYIDENGVTQQLNELAGTATLAIGPSGQRLDSGGGTNGGNGGSIDSGDGAEDLPVPVSHWRFEYDAVDWVGSSHGTESGGVAFEANEEGEGVEDHALSLDGSDDYVDLSTHVSDFPLGDSTRSVTGWFKADAGNQGQSFFSYGPNVAGKRFSIAADRTQVLVAVSGHAWGVNGLELKEGWHHVAVTYAGGDSDDILIYLDGELQSASTLVGSPKRLNTGTGPAAIGRNVGGTKHYTGLIDDVRLYDVALSAEQVLALFEEHPQTPPPLVEDNLDEPEPSEQSIEADDEEADDGAVDLPDPVSHWSFDNDAVDGAGSSHGTVSGGAAFAANEEGKGVGSHALSLDGSNDHVDLDLHVSNFPLGDSARSVTGWFKADTGNQGQTFLSYGPNVAGKRFSIAADRTQALVGVSGHGWGVNGLNLSEGWHHIAVTYAGGKSDAVLIYLDGELQSALTLAGSPAA